ncbi:MAG: DUF1015 domain-containing protein, partial [Chloroflexi bacterium]|nr:DUF1015 domain-containing protein [Chloroflexota bacterium]
MAEILPFRGVRYNLQKINLEDALSPPYDVPGQRNYENKYSIARIDSDRGGSYYHESAKLLSEFMESGILITEEHPSIYVYEQEYLFHEQLKKRRGFIAIIKLEDYSRGVVLPHEQIHAKPLEDRLNLLQACHANFNPIFSLYNGAEPDQILKTNKEPLFNINYESITHRLWVINNEKIIQDLVNVMKDKKIIIADGHHRYEASLRFSKENKDAKYVL